MAKIIAGTGTFTSTDGTSFVSNSFTPFIRDWLLAGIIVSDCVVPNPIITTSVAGVTFDLLASALYGPNVSSLYLCAAAQLVPSATTRTVTIDVSPTTGTGAALMVERISNIEKFASAAIRQIGVSSNGTPGGTPAVTFPFAPLTGSTVIWIGASSTGGFPQPPTGYIVIGNNSYATPTTSGVLAYTMGGAGQTLTSGSTCATSWCVIGVELDVRAYTSTDTPQFEAGIGV